MDAVQTDVPFRIAGNVLNDGLITNLPATRASRCPAWWTGRGSTRVTVGALPVQLAALNMTNINVQLVTVEAAVTHRRDLVYQAALLDPHTAGELSIDDVVKLCDELIEAHGSWIPPLS